MSDVVDGRVALWIAGGDFEDAKRPTHFSADQARVDLAVDAAPGQGPARPTTSATRRPTRELSRGERAAWDVYAVGRAERLGHRRPAPAPAVRLPPAHGFTDVADAAFERCWDGRPHHLGRHPGDLQGDGRRPTARRPRSPSTSSARSSDSAPARQSVVGSAQFEVVGRDRVERSIVGLRREQPGSRRAAISIISGESRWACGRVGRLPLLDHEEAATRAWPTRRGRCCGTRARAGSARRSWRAPRRAVLPRRRAGRRTTAVSTAISTLGSPVGSGTRRFLPARGTRSAGSFDGPLPAETVA